MRYAQEKKGQKLHLVREFDTDLYGLQVSLTALCGKTVKHWRMTVNLPLGNACKTCLRVRKCLLGTTYTLVPKEETG